MSATCGASSSLPGAPLFGRSGDRSSILRYLLTVGSDTPVPLEIEATVWPLLPLPRISSILSMPIIPTLTSHMALFADRRHMIGRLAGWSACPCSFPQYFRAESRNFSCSNPQLEGYQKHSGRGATTSRRGTGCPACALPRCPWARRSPPPIPASPPSPPPYANLSGRHRHGAKGALPSSRTGPSIRHYYVLSESGERRAAALRNERYRLS